MAGLTDPRLMLLSPGDSVYVLRDQIAAGEAVMVDGVAVTFGQALGLGHKIARLPLRRAKRSSSTALRSGVPAGRLPPGTMCICTTSSLTIPPPMP
jgi:hypothetical protein